MKFITKAFALFTLSAISCFLIYTLSLYAPPNITSFSKNLTVNTNKIHIQSPPKRYVVFSSTLDEKFAKLSGVSALLWRKFGLVPVVLLIGSKKEWNASDFGSRLLTIFDSSEVLYEFLDYSDKTLAQGNIAQLSRLIVGAIKSIPNDAYVIVSDGDLWPLQRAHFDDIDYSKKIQIFNANDYRKHSLTGDYWNAGRYSLCYIGAKKSVWRELIFPKYTQKALAKFLSDGIIVLIKHIQTLPTI